VARSIELPEVDVSAQAAAGRPGSGGLVSGMRDLATTFDIAARSILETQAGAGTVQSVLADRALDHQWEGLFQYAAARVGPKQAASLLVELERTVEQDEKGAIDAEVRPRAALYSRLRAALKSVAPQPLGADSSLFWPVPEQARGGYVKLRAAFSTYEREIVELRFARRLSDEDVAQVLELDIAEVKRVGIVALGLAKRFFPRRAPSRDRSYEGVLLEAFVLDPELCHAPRRSARKPVLERGHVVAGRYEVEALLGAGAFADVYRARDCVVTDHVVALKILRTRAADERSVQAALRELEVIASVFHPSIVQLNDHGWHDGHLWFVMPLYRGETLATRLTRGPLTRGEARAIFEPLAEALAAMHRAGVQHQDVKPENVFLATLDFDADKPGPDRILPVLLDLGVASKDAELVLAGTPAYFAPEVAARFLGVPDPPPVGPKADVFSLALTLRRALDPTSREHIPGGAVDAFVSFRALHSAEPPARRDLRDLTPFFARWLALKPDERPSADQLRRELAVLTRPEEQRARLMAVLRWVVPVSFAVLAMFAAVVYVLSHEASLRRIEAAEAREHAERASERAASIYASLTEQEARRKQLEQDVARLEEQYQTSRYTRDELATRLAQTEGELAVLSDRDKAATSKIKQLGDDVEALNSERDRLTDKLRDTENRAAELREELGRERSRSAESEANATRARSELTRLEADLAASQARVRELEERAVPRNEGPAQQIERKLHPEAL
jgi:serine/threonine protein kinase